MVVLNRLQSYNIRISALGPESHCTSYFKRAMYFMSTACGRPQRRWDIAHVNRGVKNLIITPFNIPQLNSNLNSSLGLTFIAYNLT